MYRVRGRRKRLWRCSADQGAAPAVAFDVCIMDLRLPGMDGDAAIRSLHRIHPRLKYLIHTGTAGYDLPDDLRTIGVGNGQIFRKPLPDMAPLAAAVKTLGAAD